MGQWSLVYTLQCNVDTNMSTLYLESQISTEKTGLICLTPTALPTSAKPPKVLSLTMAGTTVRGQNHLCIHVPTQPEKSTEEKH